MGDRGAQAMIKAVILSYSRKCELVQDLVDPAYEDTANGTGWSVNPAWLDNPDAEYKYIHVDRPGGESTLAMRDGILIRNLDLMGLARTAARNAMSTGT